MPHDQHLENRVAQLRIGRRRLLQSGGIAASSALVGAAFFPAASLAGAATRERLLSSPEPVPHAITLAQYDATPRALSTEEMSTPTAPDALNGDNFDHTGSDSSGAL